MLKDGGFLLKEVVETKTEVKEGEYRADFVIFHYFFTTCKSYKCAEVTPCHVEADVITCSS